MGAILSFFLPLLAADPGVDVQLDRPVPNLATTGKFDVELAKTVSASWRNVGLRAIARRLAEDRQISILIDRRLDPSREHVVEVANQPLEAVLERIAAAAGGAVSLVANTAYLGPPEAADRLLTLAELREAELFDEACAIPKGRQFDLSRRQTLHWNDLDTPADVLQTIAARYKLTIEGLDGIPHDLWAGATLPNVNATEALSLVLIQFDRTFAWTEAAAGIRLVPVPEDVWIERFYTPRDTSAENAADDWRQQIPGLVVEAAETRVRVRGTAEQHAAVENIMRPGRRRPSQRPRRDASLHRRLFTMRTERAPAGAVLEQLQKSGIDVRYDAEQLTAAGVDLTQLLTFEVDKATAEEFFTTICEPLGVKFEIEGQGVTLTPKPK